MGVGGRGKEWGYELEEGNGVGGEGGMGGVGKGGG